MVIYHIAGLPGSGKTHYAKKAVDMAVQSGKKAVLLDDANSKEELVGYEDFDVVYITSPHFCNSRSTRGLADLFMRQLYPSATILWEFFENNPVQCRKNVLYRNDGRKVDGFITALSQVYVPPAGAVVLPVWTPKE